MADLKVSLTLQAVDKITATARRVSDSVSSLGRSMVKAGTSAATAARGFASFGKAVGNLPAVKALGEQWGKVGDAATNVGKKFKSMIGTTAKLGGAALGLGYLFNRILIAPAAQFEAFQTQLNALSGSAEAGKKAMDWVKNFAQTTPANVAGVVEAFTQLKAFGLDPMDGTMQAVMDTTAKMGFSQERLMGISLALGQAWTSQKLQGQDIMQLLTRGVPVWDLLEKATGKNVVQLKEMSSKGELGRDAIRGLVKEMGKAAAGSAAAQMKTWNGLVANLEDAWTNFRLEIMGSGLFDFLKNKLTTLMDTIGKMAKSGELTKLAKEIGDSIQNMINKTISAIEWVGGLKNAFIILALVLSAQTIVAVGQMVWAVGGLVAKIPGAISATLAYAAANGVSAASAWALAAGVWAAIAPILAIGAAIAATIALFVTMGALVYSLAFRYEELKGAVVDFLMWLDFSRKGAELYFDVWATGWKIILAPILIAIKAFEFWKSLLNDIWRGISKVAGKSPWKPARMVSKPEMETFSMLGEERPTFSMVENISPRPEVASPYSAGNFMRTAVGGKLKIEVQSQTPVKVRELKADGPMDIEADVGNWVMAY